MAPTAPAGPLDLRHAQPAALGGLGERLGLQDAAMSNAAVRLPNGWPLTWNVLFVDPATPGQAPVLSVFQPAPVFGGDCVSRPPPVATERRGDQLAEAGNDVALLGVGLDAILHEAVGGEEQQLGSILVTLGGVSATDADTPGADPHASIVIVTATPAATATPRRRVEDLDVINLRMRPPSPVSRDPDVPTPAHHTRAVRARAQRARGFLANDPVSCRRPADSSPGGRRSDCPSTPTHGARRTPGCRTGSARSPG